jgi:molybdopterin synthase sulfur carrier subunit
MIRVLYFANIREEMGRASEEIEFSSDTHKIIDLLQLLILRNELVASVLQNKNLLVALNQEVTDISAILKDGDEVAFYPPVTGG